MTSIIQYSNIEWKVIHLSKLGTKTEVNREFQGFYSGSLTLDMIKINKIVQ